MDVTPRLARVVCIMQTGHRSGYRGATNTADRRSQDLAGNVELYDAKLGVEKTLGPGFGDLSNLTKAAKEAEPGRHNTLQELRGCFCLDSCKVPGMGS